MKKSVLALMSCLCFATALMFAGCSSESSGGSDPADSGIEDGKDDGGGSDTGGVMLLERQRTEPPFSQRKLHHL